MDAVDTQFERLHLRRAVHLADARLRAQAGAVGSVVGEHSGMLTIHFDDTEHFVELDSSGARVAHNVPRLAVEPETYAVMGRRFKVLAVFPDTDEGAYRANAYMAGRPDA